MNQLRSLLEVSRLSGPTIIAFVMETAPAGICVTVSDHIVLSNSPPRNLHNLLIPYGSRTLGWEQVIPPILFRSFWLVAPETEATGRLSFSSSRKQTQTWVDGESSTLGTKQLRPPLLRAHRAATRSSCVLPDRQAQRAPRIYRTQMAVGYPTTTSLYLRRCCVQLVTSYDRHPPLFYHSRMKLHNIMMQRNARLECRLPHYTCYSQAYP